MTINFFQSGKFFIIILGIEIETENMTNSDRPIYLKTIKFSVLLIILIDSRGKKPIKAHFV